MSMRIVFRLDLERKAPGQQLGWLKRYMSPKLEVIIHGSLSRSWVIEDEKERVKVGEYQQSPYKGLAPQEPYLGSSLQTSSFMSLSVFSWRRKNPRWYPALDHLFVIDFRAASTHAS